VGEGLRLKVLVGTYGISLEAMSFILEAWSDEVEVGLEVNTPPVPTEPCSSSSSK
jgi:hypothetical protein